MATRIPLPDYLDLVHADRRAIHLPLAADLIATKGRSRQARRRHDQAREALRAAVRGELARHSRAPYRGRVVLNLTLVGDCAATRDRSVKGLLDGLCGCLYADDAQISLLEVTTLAPAVRSGESEAIIRASSESEYRRRFDVVRRALAERDWKLWPDEDATELRNPWAWPEDVHDGWEQLDEAREQLEWARTTDLFEGREREAMIRTNEMIHRRHLREQLLEVPFGPADRPGPGPPEFEEYEPLLLGERPFERLHPTACWLPPPKRGVEGSFTVAVTEAASVLRRQWPVLDVVGEQRLALDIALDGGAGEEFDLDNIAAKVIAAFTRVFNWSEGEPTGFRIYRRDTQEAGTLVRLRSFDAFHDLERATGGHIFGLDFQPKGRA